MLHLFVIQAQLFVAPHWLKVLPLAFFLSLQTPCKAQGLPPVTFEKHVGAVGPGYRFAQDYDDFRVRNGLSDTFRAVGITEVEHRGLANGLCSLLTSKELCIAFLVADEPFV